LPEYIAIGTKALGFIEYDELNTGKVAE